MSNLWTFCIYLFCAIILFRGGFDDLNHHTIQYVWLVDWLPSALTFGVSLLHLNDHIHSKRKRGV